MYGQIWQSNSSLKLVLKSLSGCSLNLVVKSFHISVSSQCNLVHITVMLCKVNVKAICDKSRQVRVVLAILRWQNDC